MGVNHLHLRFLGEIDGETADICKESAELFAREAMPRFAETQVVGKAEMAGAG
jgi:2'-5' RNA ligase